MARSILEQILENVEAGALLPCLAEPTVAPSPGITEAQTERTVELALAKLETRLLRASSEAAAATHQHFGAELNSDHVDHLVRQFQQALCNELASEHPPTTSVSPPQPNQIRSTDPSPATEALDPEALAELHRSMASSITSERDPVLVDTVGRVAQQVRQSENNPERDHEALADIHKMIEFLK